MMRIPMGKGWLALLSAVAVACVAGLNGLAEAALVVLTCEYIGCVTQTLGRSRQDSWLDRGGLYLLVAVAACLDGLTGGMALRAGVCLFTTALAFLPVGLPVPERAA